MPEPQLWVEMPCEHGKMGKHLLAEHRFEPCERKDGSTRCGSKHVPGDPHFDCPGGDRRKASHADILAAARLISGAEEVRISMTLYGTNFIDDLGQRDPGSYLVVPVGEEPK